MFSYKIILYIIGFVTHIPCVFNLIIVLSDSRNVCQFLGFLLFNDKIMSWRFLLPEREEGATRVHYHTA